jgi:hypothetical protein
MAKKLTIEISYTWDDDEMPEHYAYCDSIDDAKKVLNSLDKMFSDPKYQKEIDEELIEMDKIRNEKEEKLSKLLDETSDILKKTIETLENINNENSD